MRKHLLSAWIVVALLLPVHPTARWAEGAAIPTADGLVLEWTAPPVQVHRLDDGSVAVAAEGYDQTTTPGAPRLPFTSTLIAIPPGASPTLRILALEESAVPLPGPLMTAPQPQGVLRDSAGRPIGGALVPAAETQAPPATPLVLEEAGSVRGVRLARVTFYPALPAPGGLRLIRHVRAEVILEQAGTPPQTAQAGDPLLGVVRRAVRNPHDATPSPRSGQADTTPRFLGGPRQAFLEVSRPGLYRATYAQLEPLGLTTADPHNLRLFQGTDEVACEWEGDDDSLFEPGESLLFYAEPRFSRWTAVDAYRLVADETAGLRLITRSADPTGLPQATPWMEGVWENNGIYTPDCFCGSLPAGRDGDRWAWADLRCPGAPTAVLFQMTAVDTAQPAHLTLWLIGYTALAPAPDHRVQVALNGTPLGQVEWDGKTAVTATLSVPPGLLMGANTLTLSLPGISGVSVEGAWLDAFAIRYARGPAPAGEMAVFATPVSPGGTPPTVTLPYQQYLPLVLRGFGGAGTGARGAYTVALSAAGPYRAYDVTDPRHPWRLTNFRVTDHAITVGNPDEAFRRYLTIAESGIRSPRVRAVEDPWGFHALGGFTGADYLIITHPAFAATLGPLVDLRSSQGLSVTVVNVLGIYDAYGDGRPDPEAIRRFIADAYATWEPRPAYVLLVGDGSFDPRQYRSDSPPTFIPPYLADVDPWAGETAADNRYACVDGDDRLPDLFIGRLPADSPAEAQATIEKIVAAERDPLPGGWNRNVLLVADDPDRAGNFPAFSEAYAAVHVATPFVVNRRYCAGSSPDSSDCTDAASLHSALLSRWNAGALLIQFTGHSSWQQWAAERFFHLDDLPALRNSRRLPVVTEMTCLTSAFHRPEPTLDEGLVTLARNGAVAAWGPTGLGVGTGHRYLSTGFFRAVFSDTVATTGEAALAGKLALAGAGLYPDLLDTYTLLGDPAQRLQRTIVPWASHVYLPLLARQ